MLPVMLSAPETGGHGSYVLNTMSATISEDPVLTVIRTNPDQEPIMQFARTTPILRIFDADKAKEFYIDFLGFNVDWEHRFEAGFPLYLQISKDDCVLHLSEHHGDCSPGAAIRIETNELDAYQHELQNKTYRYAKPEIQKMPWGTQDMAIRDPFGNRLIFTAGIST